MDYCTVIVRRFEEGKGSRLEEFKVPVLKGMHVLDALKHIQREIDGTLAFRWNCSEGICGSCSMEVDGKPVLACKTKIPGEKFLIEPMKVFPIVKDLVPDVREVREKAKIYRPYLLAKDKDQAWRMQEDQIGEVSEARKCIDCYLCYDVCHVIRNHEDKKFAGPVNIVRAIGLDKHPKSNVERSLLLSREGSLWSCNMTRCCSEICPQEIKITQNFITYAKERVVSEKNPFRKLFAMIGGKKNDREVL